MKTYKVKYTEIIKYDFFVEAETPEEAQEEFDRLVVENYFDFSKGDIAETNTEITEE